MNGLALIGTPPPPPLRSGPNSIDFTVLHGLKTAIEALTEFTDYQFEKYKATNTDGQVKLLNRCRIICLTSARDNESMKRLEEIFHNVLQQQNKIAATSDNMIVIDHVHLVIINIFPVNMESQVSNHAPKNVCNFC